MTIIVGHSERENIYHQWIIEEVCSYEIYYRFEKNKIQEKKKKKKKKTRLSLVVTSFQHTDEHHLVHQLVSW